MSLHIAQARASGGAADSTASFTSPLKAGTKVRNTLDVAFAPRHYRLFTANGHGSGEKARSSSGIVGSLLCSLGPSAVRRQLPKPSCRPELQLNKGTGTGMKGRVGREIPEKTRWPDRGLDLGGRRAGHHGPLGYLGKWYEYQKLNFSSKATGVCITAEYSVGSTGGVVVHNTQYDPRLLASHLCELGSIPGRVTPGLSQVGIAPDDGSGRRVFSGISRFLRSCIPVMLHAQLISPSSALKTSFGLTADKSWVYNRIPETKAQFSQCKTLSDTLESTNDVALVEGCHSSEKARRMCPVSGNSAMKTQLPIWRNLSSQHKIPQVRQPPYSPVPFERKIFRDVEEILQNAMMQQFTILRKEVQGMLLAMQAVLDEGQAVTRRCSATLCCRTGAKNDAVGAARLNSTSGEAKLIVSFAISGEQPICTIAQPADCRRGSATLADDLQCDE
ncbi:hypothetical protein PR048_033192 [Dryococelus australis]|uniref:Intein C-terminal splicing domain-containing protein n=1 Tax=Dryococelus australis TaxID=614101 RepID=A0ABQ9FZJ6_9NEOP|nr:hypothetical protein PR048_033192 [Dryococelus australis]